MRTPGATAWARRHLVCWGAATPGAPGPKDEDGPDPSTAAALVLLPVLTDGAHSIPGGSPLDYSQPWAAHYLCWDRIPVLRSHSSCLGFQSVEMEPASCGAGPLPSLTGPASQWSCCLTFSWATPWWRGVPGPSGMVSAPDSSCKTGQWGLECSTRLLTPSSCTTVTGQRPHGVVLVGTPGTS